MPTLLPALTALALASACGGEAPPSEEAAPAFISSAVMYEGAHFITGDGRDPITDSAFLVDDGRIVAVGQRGELGLPPGAQTVDLTDKTVVPMLVSLHGHVGFQMGLTYEAENYTPANILDHLDKYAYYGVGTILSLGTDAGDAAFQVREQQERGLLGGARLLTAGRGLAMPNAGPGAAALRGSALGVTSEDEAREAVRQLASQDVDVIKIWVDDRGGNVEKLRPELYRAIIDEAHSRNLRVIAHVYYASDAADLVEAGVDGFAHLVRDGEMSNALVAAIAGADVFVMPNLGISERGTHGEPPAWLDDPLLHESISQDVLARAKESFSRRTEEGVARAEESYASMQRSLAKLQAAGVDLVLGADSGVQDHFYGYTELRELELMVAAGMTPTEAFEAATIRPAELFGLDDVGSLVAGKSADFIVLNGNPLDDITNMRLIEDVYMKGEPLSRPAMRASFIGR